MPDGKINNSLNQSMNFPQSSELLPLPKPARLINLISCPSFCNQLEFFTLFLARTLVLEKLKLPFENTPFASHFDSSANKTSASDNSSNALICG